MKTSDISEHFTPLDRSVLEGENAYADYFKYVQFTLNCLLDSFENYKSDSPHEINIIKTFAQKFLNTIECFNLKYAMNETHPMLVDLTESGFPNHMELRRLNDDLDKKKEKMNRGQSVETLNQLILDHMIKHKTHPDKLIREISLKSYFDQISRFSSFTEFTNGELIELNPNKKGENRRFLYSWGSYDSVTNRPFIYILVFDLVKVMRGDKLDPRDKSFKESIRKITHNTAPLKVMISDIDEMYSSIKPQVMKRINLGPAYGKYSRDENAYTKLLNEKFTDEDFIFTYETEVIFSVGEKRNKSFLSSGELRQIFYINDSNKECMERMISQLSKYMITTHPVLQYLTEYHQDKLDELASKPYIVSH